MISKFVKIASFLLIIISFTHGNEIRNDMIKVYLSSGKEFFVHEDKITTSYTELNYLLQRENASTIRKWLPGTTNDHEVDGMYLNRFYVIEFGEPKINLKNVKKSLSELPFIESVEFIPIIKALDVPNDPYWNNLYALRQIKAENAYQLWDFNNGEIPGSSNIGEEIVVAIVDLGLMWDHEDLLDNIWRNLGEDIDGDGDVLEFIDGEWVFDPGDTNSIDDDGDGYIDNFIGFDIAFADNNPYPGNNTFEHGTMVAGCVSAATNNDVGIASVGWSVKMMGVNAATQSPYISHGYEGILAAAEMGADIINLSWGGTSWFESHQALINYVHEEYDCVIVSSAGNSGEYGAHYPASYDNVISVSGTLEGSNFHCGFNYHETVDITAPGVNIWTTIPYSTDGDDKYQSVLGTSFSAPYVSGAFALLKSVFPETGHDMLVHRILNTAGYYADMEGECNGQGLAGLLGHGQLDIHGALLTEPIVQLNPLSVSVMNSTGLMTPGDTSMISVSISNSSFSTSIDSIYLHLTNEDPNISIIDDQYMYAPSVGSDETFEALFTIAATEYVSFGESPFFINMQARINGNFPSLLNFETHLEIDTIFVPIGFVQDGYPIEDVAVTSSPMVIDLYGNSLPQIFFASDSIVHGKWMFGIDALGFPLNANSRIITSLSGGDLDNDGDRELIFGTDDGRLCVVNKDGSEFMTVENERPILDFIVLYDMNNNEFLEMVYVTESDSISFLNIIDHNGNHLPGFPMNLLETSYNAPSVGDLDQDGYTEVILASDNGFLTIIDHLGMIKDGYPMNIGSPIEFPATVVDLDGNSDLEIIVGDSVGTIHVFNDDSSLLVNFETNRSISSSLSIADLNQNGFPEIIFVTVDNHVYVWEPFNDIVLDGWPIVINGDSKSEPIVTDIDNDNELEIIISETNGVVHLIDKDGISLNNFPYLSQDTYHFSPALGDLDNDGDSEIIFGSDSNLRVLDINTVLGSQYSWNAFRSNNHRNGFYDAQLSFIMKNDDVSPNSYHLNDNFPNPFNPITRITFNIPVDGKVAVNIYDVRGRHVKQIINDRLRSGLHTVSWNGEDENGIFSSSGLYFYELVAEEYIRKKKMILLK